MNNGWIKLHRSLLDWEWYSDKTTLLLFIHLLITVNHAPTKWRGVDVFIGETIKSLDTIVEESGLSVQNVRTSINRLKSTGELTQRQHGKYRILQLVKYKDYQQSNTEDNILLTPSQQGSNRDLTHNKNIRIKELKNEKKNTYGEMKNVKLLEEEYQKLKDKFGSTLEGRIENLSLYIASKGDHYTSHYATILSWAKKDPVIKQEVSGKRDYKISDIKW